MSIAFECPHCQKSFKVADALAGRKAKCSGCGRTIAIPLPKSTAKPPRPKAPAADLDVYGLADAVEATATTTTDDDSSSPSSGGSLPKLGAALGWMTIQEVSPARLTLANTGGGILRRLLLGAALVAAGGALAYGFELWVVTARPARMMNLMIMVPFAIMGAGAAMFCVLARLGYQLVIDRDSRTLSIRRFGSWETTWPAADLGGVVFCVIKVKNEQCGDECPQEAEGFIVNRSGKAVALLERVSSKRSGEALRLADVCLRAGRLLGLPVSVEQRGEPKRAEIKRAVDRIRNESLRRPAAAPPRVRPPMLTIYTVGVAVAVIVLVGGVGRFMLRYTTLGDAVESVVDHVAPDQRPLLDMVQGQPNEAIPQPPPGQPPQEPRQQGEIEKYLDELRSPDPATRSFAMSGLEHREPVDDQRDAVCARLRELLASDVESDRRGALKALNKWGTDDDAPLFIKEMTGPFPGAAEEATVVLARRQDPRGAEAMAQLLHNKDRRFTMAVRLGEIGAPAIPFVLPLLDDPDDEVKREAVGILARIATRADVPAMEAALERLQGVVNGPQMKNASPFTPEGARRRELESVIFFLRAAIPQAASRS